MIIVGLPAKFVFKQKNGEFVEWSLVDGLTVDNDVPTAITDATVTAALYLHRRPADVINNPGTVIANCNALVLPAVADVDGLYRKNGIDASLWALSEDYTLVIHATTPGGGLGHWEKAAEVVVRDDQ